MKIQILTLFPEMFESYFAHSMMWKARQKKLLELEYLNLRDFGIGPRRQVDDTPYGGGDGMVLRADVVVPAIESAKKKSPGARVILLTPQGSPFRQADARRLSGLEELILVCGHYEGFDERIRDFVDEQISIGDYVLTGGELPAMVLIDAVARLVPGVLGGDASADVESFSDGQTLEYPQYTRPEEFQGRRVPDVLLSGHHAEIAAWRASQAQQKTARRSDST
jgi:tRNA (guanine37-N1)-methyltransferase